MQISFTVPGEPRGKGRPRFSTANGRVTTRTPHETAMYENLIRLEYQRQCAGMRFADDAELAMTLFAYYAIPKSASKKKKLAMLKSEMRPIKTPDLDNVIKAVGDSLNQIAYRDDAQIVEVHACKHYSTEPRLEIVINLQGGET